MNTPVASEYEMSTDHQEVKLDCDTASITEASSVIVYHTAGLVKATRTLANHASRATDPIDASSFAVATLLTAVAAVDATLAEYLFITNRPEATAKFFRKGIADKYEIIKALKSGGPAPVRGREVMDLDEDYPEVAELVRHRHAISHSEPENSRSRRYGYCINPTGARWAADTVQAFVYAIWDGVEMPAWLKDDLS